MIGSSSGIRLARRDWISLGGHLALGITISFIILQVGIRLLLEPLMVSESSLRIAKNIILVEEVLRRMKEDELPSGLILNRSLSPPSNSSASLNRFDRLLQRSLLNDRGLNRAVVRDAPPFIDPLGGHWIRLNTASSNGHLWLYQADRLSSSLWFMGPLRGATLAMGMMAGLLLFLRNQLIQPISRISASLPNGANRRAKLIAEEGMLPVRSLCAGVNRLLERINANESDRRNLILGLVHDFSGPTTRAILRVEQLAIEFKNLDTSRLETILNDLSHLSSLAEQLRRLTESGALEGQRQEAALDDLCHRISDRYDRDQIIVQTPRILALLDVNGLERAIGNLIDNAIEYGKPPVLITARCRKRHLSITIDDHGRGIGSPTSLTMPHASRTSDRERKRHQGLGLAIVETFCHQHNGELRLSNSPHGGLRAELLLPASVLLHGKG